MIYILQQKGNHLILWMYLIKKERLSMKFKKLMTIGLSSMMVLGGFAMNSNAETTKVKMFNYIAGEDRVKTSILTSNYVDSRTLVLANAYNFADALSSYNIVASKKAKLVLVGDNTNIENILKDNNIEKVYLIGGENTLKGKPVEDTKRIVGSVERIAGNNRYTTNEATLKKAGYDEVGVADGRNFPDALAASGLLSKKDLGLMLVNGAKPYTSSRPVKYTFGGTNSVKQEGGKRIAGNNRWATSREINKEVYIARNLVFASGQKFADALSALNFVNLKGGMALVSTEAYTNNDDFKVTDRYFKENELGGKFFVVGGDLNLYIAKKSIEETESKKISDVPYDMMLKSNDLANLIGKEEDKYRLATNYKEKENILKNIKSYLIQKNNIDWKRYNFCTENELSCLRPSYPENYNFECVYDGLDLRMNAEQLEKADKEKSAKEKAERETKKKAEKEKKEKEDKDKNKDNKEVSKSVTNQ